MSIQVLDSVFFFQILADIEDFVIRGKAHVEVIGDLLVSQNLDSKEKV